jgi:hypothetical protein
MRAGAEGGAETVLVVDEHDSARTLDDLEDRRKRASKKEWRRGNVWIETRRTAQQSDGSRR